MMLSTVFLSTPVYFVFLFFFACSRSSLAHFVFVEMYVAPYTLRNKGTKAVTGAVPFQKVHVCT